MSDFGLKRPYNGRNYYSRLISQE